MVLLLLVAAAFVFGVAQPAEARELTPTERAQVQDVASQAFTQSRCAGAHLNVAWQHEVLPAPTDTLALAAITVEHRELAGYAYGAIDGSCDVGLRSDLDPLEACTIAVHEAGHLADTYIDEDGELRNLTDGPHHGDGTPVMGTADTPTRAGGEISTDYAWPACLRMTSITLNDALDWFYDRVSNETRLECTRRTASQMQCVTSRPREHRSPVRKVWRVWATGVGQVKGARVR